MKQITVKENNAGQRLDRFLQKNFETLPKSLMFKEIRKKNIKINKKRCTPEQTLCTGDEITLYLPDDVLQMRKVHFDFLKAPKAPDVVYEDENVLLLNKKQGELCHPDGKEYVNTLLASVKRYLYEKGDWSPENENAFTPALANRIDRNTSGIVIAAKNYDSLKILAAKIREREIEKYYLTIVEGVPQKQNDTLTAYLTKNEKTNTVTVTDTARPDSKEIVTRYRVLDSAKAYSLLEVELLTGRTHQIRAQLAHLGHPLLGDGKYGTKHGRTKQELCSYKLHFRFDTDAGRLNYLKGKTFTLKDCRVAQKFSEIKNSEK